MQTIKTNLDKKILNTLIEIAGKDNVLFEQEDLYAYSVDATALVRKVYCPDAVVLPENTRQVSEILKLAYENNIPIIPRGAGTNHVGGCVPIKGGIVLHFSKMNKILDINSENLTCSVQPGLVVEVLQKEVEKIGLFYPPDPSNLRVSTIGGSIALSSGGPRCFKYGTTKDYVIGLEVVTADGEIIRTGGSTVKNVAGLNLTQLFVGSEGTLGIVTEATLKLIPKPDFKKVMLVFFDSIDDAAQAVTEIISNRIIPASLDLLDKNTMVTVEKFKPTGVFNDKEASLLIEVDGSFLIVEEQIKQIQKICSKNGACEIKIAKNEEEAENIWISRRAAFGAVSALGADVVTEDAVVPRNKIPQFINEIRRICDKYSLTACIMGHAGDGNIHPNFSIDLRDEQKAKNFEKGIDELFECAIALGGTITGEHGIGIAKAKYLENATSQRTVDYMKAIKNSFDSKGILNPGKIY